MNPKTVKKSIYFLLALALFSPLIVVSNSVSPFYFGKAIFFRSFVLVSLVFYILLIAKDRRYVPKINIVGLSLLVFLGVWLLTSVTGVNFHQSFYGEFLRMGGFVNLSFFFLFFLIASNTLNSEDQWGDFFKISIFAAVLVSLGALFFSTQQRISGTVGNAALFAGYILPHAFLSLWFFGGELKRSSKSFYAGLFVFFSAMIFLTAVRGALLALFIGSLIFTLLYLKRNKKLAVYFTVFLLIIVAAYSVLFSIRSGGFVQSNFYLSKITNLGTDIGNSVGNRLAVWNIAWEGFKERPLLGWGPDNFQAVFNKHFNPLLFENSFRENTFDRAHNIFLEVVSTMGIMGLISYIFIWAALFVQIKKRKEKFLIPIFVAILVHNLFIFDSFSGLLAFFTLLAYISRSDVASIGRKDYNLKFRAATVVLIILILALANFLIIQPISAYFSLAKLKENPDEIFWSKDVPTKYFARREIASRTLTVAILADKPGKNFKNDFEFTVGRLKESIREEPYNISWYLFLGGIYNEAGRLINPDFYKDAEYTAKEALKVSPSRQQVYYQLARSLAGQGKFDEALKVMDRALILNPKADESYWRLGLLYTDFADFEEGYRIIREADQKHRYPYYLSFADTMKKIELEIKKGNLREVAYLYEKFAIGRFYPHNAQLHASLAATYARLGENEKALKYVQKAVELDPSFKKEAENFVKTLK